MSIVVLTGEKGGTGKSILATNLAAMRAAAGRDVLLIDTDTQGSASGWQAMRTSHQTLARVHCVQKFGKTLSDEVRDLSNRYQDIIIDSGGRDSIEMRASLLVANVAVLPFQPAQFDLWTVAKVHALLEQVAAFNTGIRALAVVNQAETNHSMTDYLDAKELIAEYQGIELLEYPIRKRVAFKRAAALGMSVVEYDKDPNSKAVKELTQLYHAVFAS